MRSRQPPRPAAPRPPGGGVGAARRGLAVSKSAESCEGLAPNAARWVCVFPSRRRHTRCLSDWSSDVCSSDLHGATTEEVYQEYLQHLEKRGAGDYHVRDVERLVGGLVNAFPENKRRTDR